MAIMDRFYTSNVRNGLILILKAPLSDIVWFSKRVNSIDPESEISLPLKLRKILNMLALLRESNQKEVYTVNELPISHFSSFIAVLKGVFELNRLSKASQ